MSERYLLASIGHSISHAEHIVWWRANRMGYSVCTDAAGRYSLEEARFALQDSRTSIAVPESAVTALAKPVPYMRAADGLMCRMYGGGVSRPVENSAESWASLMPVALDNWRMTMLPSPMPLEQRRAIYIGADFAREIAA